jgi:ElaB/YqjD/DUF883 family membrane-anchored ribosome-binding protein
MTVQTTTPFPQAPAEKIKRAATELKDQAADAAQIASEETTRIGELAKDWFQQHARSALDAAAAVRDESALVRERTRAYVRDEPMKSVLIAVAVGAVIGSIALFASRRPQR